MIVVMLMLLAKMILTVVIVRTKLIAMISQKLVVVVIVMMLLVLGMILIVVMILIVLMARAKIFAVKIRIPYSVRMREYVDQNNSGYGHFLRSVTVTETQFSFAIVNSNQVAFGYVI